MRICNAESAQKSKKEVIVTIASFDLMNLIITENLSVLTDVRDYAVFFACNQECRVTQIRNIGKRHGMNAFVLIGDHTDGRRECPNKPACTRHLIGVMPNL